MSLMRRRNIIFYLAYLWIRVCCGDGAWCDKDCECENIENDYEDTEVLCSSSVLRIRMIQNNAHFSMRCELLNVIDGNLTELVQGFHLRLGELESLEIQDCFSPPTFSGLFNVLQITQIRSLTIEANTKYPVILNAQTLPKSTLLGKLKVLILRNSGFLFDPTHALLNLESLENLEVTGTRLSPNCPRFNDLKNLKALKLHKVTNLILQEDTFLGLTNLTFLSLTSNGLIDLPKDVFKPLHNLVICKLSSNLLKRIPPHLFSHNSALKEVIWYMDDNANCLDSSNPCVRDFATHFLGNCPSLSSFYYSSGNPLMKVNFHEDIFSKCEKLSTLHITSAGLSSSDVHNFQLHKLLSLEKLTLYKNNISTLERTLLPQSSLLVNLENNPLNCSDCETLRTYLAIKTVGQVRCGRSFSNLSSDGLPHDAWRFYNCSQKEILGIQQVYFPLYFYVTIAIGLILILIVLLLTFVILTNQSFRIKLYNHRFWSIFFENEEVENAKYDAFISYAEEDSDYVHKVIIPGLEEGRRVKNEGNGDLQRTYSCCDHHRDWLVGEEIMKNILQSVKTSSRTIIILSPHFLSSSWARIEFEEAYIKRKVIMILRGSHDQIADSLKAFPSIQNYLETFTYLKEDDPLFWEKLTYLLPHRKMQKSPKNIGDLEQLSGRQNNELKELVPNLVVEEN